MAVPLVVLDTNVLVAALRSRRGASFQLVWRIGQGFFEFALSVPLVLEYEQALLQRRPRGVTVADVAALLDYVCAQGRHQEVFYLWRPLLRDPKDDMVLEVAVAASCEQIVTHNRRDFAGAEQFGVLVASPAGFLGQIRETT
ncbi:MAG: putative toxin-antitoxin system toxin component, PIN family [Burkholderiales bacterium]